jgi:hypothetical protein
MRSGDKLNNRNRAGLSTKKEMKVVAFIRTGLKMGSQAVAETVGDGSGQKKKKNAGKSTTLPDWKRALCHLVGIV